MDFFDKIREKFTSNEKIEEAIQEKEQLKQKYFNKRMKLIQQNLEAQNDLSYRQKFDLLLFLKVYMNDDELVKIQQMRQQFSKSTYISTAFGFASVVAVACVFRSYMKLGSWSKFFVSSGTFLTAHYVSMYSIQNEAVNLCDDLIQKYKEPFLSSNFVTGSIQGTDDAYSTILTPHMQYKQYREQKQKEREDKEQKITEKQQQLEEFNKRQHELQMKQQEMLKQNRQQNQLNQN
ncbi:hypothetical protein PPERSA_08800 [Pseudocohnilembus persalinus]|uniref:Transmembrane protein n=1 Tax=Pseudocohnilembus persalinus TaxID=266149 RepID=A0A0V0R3K0_PSEPJ|nr:hypothetical protein PPERSA_08800 [Pseudocohnilembus persalinus]|eukprot:KRX09084.1 hypothetical protein PPERSA_08800 [Pseudocohnilembus persalinus]